MHKPDYSLKKAISITSGPMADPIEFPSGTLIFPFWNDFFVPAHIKEDLEAKTFYQPPGTYIICLIGQTWAYVDINNIRELR